MKKALLFCLSLLLLTAAHLQAAPANMNITSERGVPFNLRFDGRTLTRGGARQVHLNRIAPGVHWAEFMIPVGYGRSVSYRTRVFLDPGLETSFVLLTRPGRGPELRKVAAVPVRGGYDNGGYPNGGYGGVQGGSPRGADEDYDDSYGNQPAPGQPGGYGNGGYPNNNGGNNSGYPNGNSYPNGGNNNGGGYYGGSSVSYNRVMAPQDVDALVAAVHRQSFDKDKLPMARLALSETGLRAEDLTRLMKELSFEDSKMELAKYGSSRVVDRQNLYRLNEGFTFSHSANELQEYLAQQAPR
ncbi:DUF4476 domain-containing protein [Hymenobacter canadensis]|uniref:DUF4476 domain-containing protein n=1 Tax=Hymenobacter canadensis TaxID=2999067 RepID=A0ABY7LP42_9BACT|nr:DUF4476 domain-containing protein [Hymenobacter canadensis]WBA41236.1 DUF4476 domain-containing protein [Hymenobacter canadensis]